MEKAAVARFRRNAAECREIAEQVEDLDWRKTLTEIAQDLEDEADRMMASPVRLVPDLS